LYTCFFLPFPSGIMTFFFSFQAEKLQTTPLTYFLCFLFKYITDRSTATYSAYVLRCFHAKKILQKVYKYFNKKIWVNSPCRFLSTNKKIYSKNTCIRCNKKEKTVSCNCSFLIQNSLLFRHIFVFFCA
jgi:hypothetical protein